MARPDQRLSQIAWEALAGPPVSDGARHRRAQAAPASNLDGAGDGLILVGGPRLGSEALKYLMGSYERPVSGQTAEL